MIAGRIVLAGFLIGLGTGTAAAQATGEDPLQIGDRIRLTTAGSSAATKGTLVAADNAALTVALEGQDAAPRQFARSEIAKLEVVRGRKSHWIAGAVAGAAGGLALAAIYCGDETCDESGEKAGSAAFFGGIGAAGGALVGALIRTDRWKGVPADKLQVGVSPLRGRGLALTLRLTF